LKDTGFFCYGVAQVGWRVVGWIIADSDKLE